MKRLLLLAAMLCASALAALPAPGTPEAPKDARYCGEPKRHANGKIKRDPRVLREFVAVFPCPTTLKRSTSCPGFALDHTIPLASGGCDSAANLTWLPTALKSCAGRVCKDRGERKYHAIPRQRISLKGAP